MKKNCWILGGTGFIGRELVKYLADTSDFRLHLLVHQNIPFRQLENHSLFTGNLEDFDWTWLEKYPPAIIFHLARLGGSNPITRSLFSMKGARANVRLIRFLMDLPARPIIVYVSGSLMYGPQENGQLADENSAWNPVSYARYYFTGEKPWLNAQYSEMMDIRFARPGWIVGKGSWLETFYVKPYLLTGKIPLYGDGTQLMSLIHSTDCARQIVALAEKGEKRQNLNIFTGPPVTQHEFAELLAGKLNAKLEPIAVEQLKKLYGQTVTDALTTSVPMKTVYPELHSTCPLLYPDAKSIVEAAGSFFESKQSVFTETP